MKCGELHGDGDCETTLKPSWRWCPECGRPCAHVEWLDSSMQVPTEKQQCRLLRIRNPGQAPASVDVSEEDDSVEITNPGLRLLHPGAEDNLQIDVAPLYQDRVVRFTVRADTGSRRGENWWVKRPWDRVGEFEVHIRVGTPGGLVADATFLPFRQLEDKRKFVVTNTGDEPISCRMEVPLGYEVTPREALFSLMAKGRREFTVAINPASPVKETSAAIRFSVEGCEAATLVQLYRIPRLVPKAEYRFVVGVDFGTRNTSVAIRDTLPGTKPELSVDFIPPDRPREPTMIYRSLGGASYYGREAEVEAERDPMQAFGIVIADLKSPLRLPPGHPEAEPYVALAQQKGFSNPEEFSVDRLLADYLRWVKQGIDAAVRARMGDVTVSTHYVFTLPVLDRGRLYELQKSRTLRAAKAAGFPTDDPRWFTVEYEPVAATWYFLRGRCFSEKLRDQIEKIRGRLHDGVKVCVIDSGSGTTDVVLGIARADGPDKLAFEVMSQLGLDSEGRVLGGNAVTKLVQEALERAIGPAALKDEPGLITRLTSRSEDVKIKLSQFVERDGNPAYTGSDVEVVALEKHEHPLGEEIRIRRKDIDDFVKRLWPPLETAIRRDIFNAASVKPVDVDLVLPVGGNTHIPYLRRLIGINLFSDADGQRVKDADVIEQRVPDVRVGDKDDKMLAVVLGSLWTPDMAIDNALPFSLSVAKEGESEPRCTFGGLSVMRQEHEDLISWVEDEPLVLEVRCRAAGAEGRMGRFEIEAARARDNQFRLHYRLSPGRLAIVDAWTKDELHAVEF